MNKNLQHEIFSNNYGQEDQISYEKSIPLLEVFPQVPVYT